MTLRSMFSAVAGLRNHQTRLDVIGNNISNVNTVGFKAGRVTFQDIFSQTLWGALPSQGTTGGINPAQVGLGSKVGTIDTIFNQGIFQATGRTFDLAIEGEGFFTLSDSNVTGTGERFFTRAGNFNIDARGYLVNPSNGYLVQGLLANERGLIDRALAPQAIWVDFSEVSPDVVTRNITLGGNLNSVVEPAAATDTTSLRALFNEIGEQGNLRIGDVIQFAGGTIGATSLADVAITTVTADTTLEDLVDAIQTALRDNGTGDESVVINEDGTLRFTTGTDAIADVTFEVVDVAGAGGTPRADQTSFLNSVLDDGDGDIDVAASSDVETVSCFRQADATTSIDVFDLQGNARTVTIAFARSTDPTTPNNVWNWQTIVPHVDGNTTTGDFPSGDTGTLVFTSTGVIDTTLTLDFPPLIFDPDGSGDQNGGVAPLQINLDFSALTQFASSSTAAIESQDGSPQGTLDSITIDTRGVIRGLFTNGVTRDLAQVLLATVPNNGGMVKVGDSLFQASPSTGTAVLGEPMEGGRGAISSGTLELSNVDLATEFTDLIITQRGFQANARVITTGDEILNELVNIL